MSTAPLTAAQQRLWFLAQLDPAALDYHIPLAYRLDGPLDTAALAGALGDIVTRHGALRTRFPLDGTDPVQEILDGWRPDVPVLTVAGDVTGAVAELANTPFDLTAAPPLRAAIVRVAPDAHIFVLVLHHILADARSLDLLRDELAKQYTARLAGEAPALPPLAFQYADHAATPRPDRSAALAYWTEQLAGAPALDLPTDHPRPARRGTDGAFDGFDLGPERGADLRTLAKAGRTTPFMTLSAVYLALLGLATGQDDISVGTPLSGRNRTEVEPLIGYFLDTVVLRADLSGDPTFRELLAQVRSTCLAAYQHGDIPARGQLFDTMFVVHSGAEDHGLALPGVTASYFDPGHRSVKFDLTLECFTGGGALKVVAQSRRDLFDPPTIASLVARFGALLRLAAADPDARLSTLFARITEAEQGPWACAGPAPAGHVLDLIDFTSAAPAVEHGATVLSYAELDARARRLADRLQGHRGLVAVQLPPGIDLIVALLAAWRAGAGYLPLDPDAPPRRIADQLAGSGAGLLVTADGIQRLDSGADTAPPAYAIFTSGSTGHPKAVAVAHTALAVRVRWMRDRYGLTAADRVLQFAAPTFDTFGEEVYPCLAAGATLVIPTGARAELPDFLKTAPGRRLTVLDLPTSYWHELCTDPAALAWPPGLRLLVLGGEQVRADALTRWFEHVGDRVEVLNTYGPTEATIIATAARLTPADATGRPPIGHPIGGTCAHIVGLGAAPVPDGVAGELVLGGPGLADGYLGRPDLTAERFTGGHYRTGDRARRRPGDGALEFLGRVDEQLKVRGYRIEPGEVEAALLTHPAIAHAVVGADGDGGLVAHLVPVAGGPAPAPAQIRAHLGALLPPYLHPRAFAFVERLPMTRHGKVDRAALPPVAPAGGDGRGPASDGELLVAAVWEAVLQVRGVRADDDFFDLGGHSLLATRVAARLRSDAGVEVPLRTIFEHTTVAGLAVAVEELLLAEIDALDDDEVRRLLAAEAEE
ncbi:AMP-binding protein [Dactylosporangium vinaceum]|uniref:Condensation domain-containing protein n=1 Tax=Dactylosporangium vinaceum TaxID=53362 RepID=A0ABV5M5Y4_9ACTN|nr:condensation domain-containing protein [Dactylosporangium vinaceum]UAC01259.1 AMP-binding protein [Dactylosporangium vinaceum]